MIFESGNPAGWGFEIKLEELIFKRYRDHDGFTPSKIGRVTHLTAHLHKRVYGEEREGKGQRVG